MRGGRIARQALATAAGLGMDRLLGEPPTAAHPVVGFGWLMGRLERVWWADRRGAGAAYAVAGVAVSGAAGRLVRSTTGVVALASAGRELRRVAAGIDDHCRRGDLAGARHALPSLVGRDPRNLDGPAIAAAVIESLAENTVDAVIAPAFWGVVAGAPGAAAYRAINTMDAMVGHRSDRYLRFGWAAARLDDLANLIPARLFAALVVIVSPGHRREIVRAVRRDARHHPSPNAGVAETAVAAALGVELGGPLRYGEHTEIRPRLGSGPRPGPDDIGRTIRLVQRTETVSAVTLSVVSLSWMAVDALRRGSRR